MHHAEDHRALKRSKIQTRLGPMVVIADDEALYLVAFTDQKGLQKQIEWLTKKTNCQITSGKPAPTKQIEDELNDYFSFKNVEFKTPLFLMGSPFQETVWKELQKIPRGQTRSYGGIAEALGKPSAFRAVALANGANRFAIVIPCHRVIYSNGNLGGYAGGIEKKEWLLKHERQ